MDTTIKDIGTHVIYSTEAIQRGIFLRSPLKNVEFTDGETDKYHCWEYLNKSSSRLFRVIQILLGNKYVVDNIREWSDDMNWAGFSANVLMSPIYFKRTYRELHAYAQNADENVQEVHSSGYEAPYETCAGSCEVEHTVMKLKNGKRIRHTARERYLYTYTHIVEGVIKTNKRLNEVYLNEH